MSLDVALLAFPVIFLGELPDKTMFASLTLSTRGRPVQVWIGAACAFVVHVAIAVSVGVALYHLAPRAVVDGIVAAGFFAGAVYSWRSSRAPEAEEEHVAPSRGGMMIQAFLLVFAAEWGDLTQVLTANLAAKYGSPVSVAIGAVAALWAVAALAVVGGRGLLRVISVRRTKELTAIVLFGLAAYAAWSAAH